MNGETEMEICFNSLDEMLETARLEATGEQVLGMFEWHSGRASGMIAAALHLGALDVETYALFSEIRSSWTEYNNARISRS